jgi:hypothetical protein
MEDRNILGERNLAENPYQSAKRGLDRLTIARDRRDREARHI